MVLVRVSDDAPAVGGFANDHQSSVAHTHTSCCCCCCCATDDGIVVMYGQHQTSFTRRNRCINSCISISEQPTRLHMYICFRHLIASKFVKRAKLLRFDIQDNRAEVRVNYILSLCSQKVDLIKRSLDNGLAPKCQDDFFSSCTVFRIHYMCCVVVFCQKVRPVIGRTDAC